VIGAACLAVARCLNCWSSLREVTVGFRSEDYQVGPNGILEAVIHDVENDGMEKIVELRKHK
jgi:hypothetical protein